MRIIRIVLLCMALAFAGTSQAQYTNRDGYTIWQGRMSIGNNQAAGTNLKLQVNGNTLITQNLNIGAWMQLDTRSMRDLGNGNEFTTKFDGNNGFGMNWNGGHWGTTGGNSLAFINLAGWHFIQSFDAPNGIFFGTYSSAPIVFETSNSERMRLSAGGNFIIGTNFDDATNKLQVNGGTKIQGSLQVLNRAILGNAVDNGTAVLQAKSMGQQAAILEYGGNNEVLLVKGEITNGGNVTLNISSSNTTSGSSLRWTTNMGVVTQMFAGGGTNSFMPDGMVIHHLRGNFAINQGAAGKHILFNINSFGEGTGTKMKIANSGNILIGTVTDAGYKLDVSGTARVQGALTTANLAAAPTGDNGAIYYNTTTNTFQGYQNGAWVDFVAGTSGSGTYIQNQSATTQTGDFKISGNGTLGQLIANTSLGSGTLDLGAGAGQRSITRVQNISNDNTNGILLNALVGGITLQSSTTASSAIARGVNVTPTLTATANNDVLVGLDINPTFNNGAFTGVKNYTARFNGDIIIGVPTSVPNGASSSNKILIAGNIYNSAVGGSNIMSGGLQINSYQHNSNPTVSKLSFLVGTDNNTPTEQMYVTSSGLFGINGGASFSAPNKSNVYNITLSHSGLATSNTPVSSNKLVLKGNAWNSAQGSAPSMGYLQMVNVVNNANPTTDKLSFFVGSANNVNSGDLVDGNATERFAIRTDGVFDYFNSSGTNVAKLFNTGNLVLQNGGTFTDAGYRLDVQGTGHYTGLVKIDGDLGIGITPTTNSGVQVQKNFNGTTAMKFENLSSGVNAFTAFQFGQDVTGGTKFMNIGYGSSGVTNNGIYKSLGTFILNNGSGGLGMGTLAGGIHFYSGGWQDTYKMAEITAAGNLILQNSGTFTDDGANRLQVTGSGKFTQNLTVTGRVIMASAVDDGTTGLQIGGLAKYSNDFSSSFSARSLVDKGYVDKVTSSYTINAQTGTTYTLALTDAGQLVEENNAADITVTVPTNSTVAFPVGSRIDLVQANTGRIVLTPAAGVTLLSADGALKSRVQYSSVTLVKKATDTWYVMGDTVNY